MLFVRDQSFAWISGRPCTFNAFVPGVIGWAEPLVQANIHRAISEICVWVAAEFENVPLGDSQVLQQLPGGMRRSRWFRRLASLTGKSFDGLVEGTCAPSPSSRSYEMLA